MKVIFIAVGIVLLAGAIVFHAQTGRYTITAVGGLAGVYRVDTRTGDLSICSPVHKHGCVTIEEIYRTVEQRKQNVLSTAAQAQNKVNEFTKNRARDLKHMIKKLDGSEEKQ